MHVLKNRSLDKIPKTYAKWHQRCFLLTRSQSRHIGKTDEGNLKLALNVASSNDKMSALIKNLQLHRIG